MVEGDAVRAILGARGPELLLVVCPRTSRLEELSVFFFSRESWCRFEASSRRSTLREAEESFADEGECALGGREGVFA